MESSLIRGELAQRYADKELVKMWSQFWALAKVMAVMGVLYATHTMGIFILLVSVVVFVVAYKLNKIDVRTK